MRMSGRILQNREGGKCLREIIVDRENGAKAFVLFELTKGNIAEIKDRYILEQLRSAIDSPWSTALPDGIRSALTRSVSEEMEDRFLLENMDKDTDRSVRNAIRSAVIKVKGQHGVKNGPWADAYGDADVLDYAYQEIITRFSDGPGALLDEIEIPEGYRIISGEKWASDLSGIGREWVDDINPYLEGRTRIKKVNEDQPLFPNTGAGLLIQKNKLTDDWTALNVSDGHYEEESFNHEALAAAFLQGANMGQLRMLNEILDRARLNGPYCLENVADALLSFAPACKAESLMENPMLHFIELSKSFSKNGGIYDPVHGIYIDSKVNGLGDVPHFTLYDVSVADIEECMAYF